ncbi:hypothetical protein DFP72DRAFT_894925 [Ephemerocybe angulata]|uniref:Uncharacterized protein n=1 Tax=Ephemerocybe angulata TaxID=980116 RepID=A0A8H6HZN8_9AGAR|nr:hypothetical protein DFP72DRAFT_894925 [Tulosesus angulatus]
MNGVTHTDLEWFFIQYGNRHDFQFNAAQPATSEFRRLCSSLHLKKGALGYVKVHQAFADAMATQFGLRYGNDMDDMAAWQKLCARLGFIPAPDSLDAARSLVLNADVNLVDLTDDSFEGKHRLSPRLCSYKVFPIGSSKAGDILTTLLALHYGGDTTAWAGGPSIGHRPGPDAAGISEEVPSASAPGPPLVDRGMEPGPPEPPASTSTIVRRGVAMPLSTTRSSRLVLSGRLAAFQRAPVQVFEEHGAKGPLYDFFALPDFQGFRYESVDPMEEFERLWKHLELRNVVEFYPEQRDNLYQQFELALIGQFESVFGEDTNSMCVWAKLGRRFGVCQGPGTPYTLHGIREIVWMTYVNMVDVMNPAIPDGCMPKFSTVQALISYTLEQMTPSKKFPWDGSRKSILSCLLRRIPDSLDERQVFDEVKPGGPLYTFFASYSSTGFVYEPGNPTTEFHRLWRNTLGLNFNSDRQTAMYLAFGDALSEQFTHWFTGNVSDRHAWETLCRRLGLRPIPSELKDIQELVIFTFTNMVDVVDVTIPDGMMLTFDTETNLSHYSREECKPSRIFPLSEVEKEDILSMLLRHIYHPREGMKVGRRLNARPRERMGVGRRPNRGRRGI